MRQRITTAWKALRGDLEPPEPFLPDDHLTLTAKTFEGRCCEWRPSHNTPTDDRLWSDCRSRARRRHWPRSGRGDARALNPLK